LITWLSLFFAGVAVLLSCMGIYGLLAYSVGRRTREIGIRMALGATPATVVRAIAREGFWVGVAGLACGVPGALAAGPFIRSLLHGLEASDARTMVGACVLFLILTVIAGLLPAYRAARIDPTVALRQQ
jgi:ABC-type antimicrobial peptide transport system permease subunit